MKVRRAIISIILILSVLASTVVMLRLDSDKEEAKVQEAQAATFDDSGKIEYLTLGDNTAAFGTTQNPFTILEIVPYAGYAEIGYLIGGKEPVDMARLSAIALGTVSSDSVSAEAAKSFIEYLAAKEYMELLTEAEAEECNKKDAELPVGERKLICYQYAVAASEDTKCYVTNANSFLRESIGLKYVTDGNTIKYDCYDVDRFEFLGWCEKGTNVLFDFSKKLFRDVELYAKWGIVRSDKSKEEPVIATPTPNPLVPADGYPDGITVHFAENLPASLQGQASIAGLPADIVNVKTDGTVGGSVPSEPVEPTLTGTPEAENYILRGWYLDKTGTTPYEFGSAIPSNYITDGVMTLYPWWVQKQACVITFDAKLPEDVIAGNDVVWPNSLSNPENGGGKTLRALSVAAGSYMEEDKVPELYLLGNVDYKVKNFVIDVVTVTPEELNKGGNVNTNTLKTDVVLDNQGLIEKANIIMLSPQSHFFDGIEPISKAISINDNNNNKSYHKFGTDQRTAVDIWKDCFNQRLFENPVMDEKDAGIFGFLHNDLCWEVTLAIFEETVLAEQKAALVYDAECYHMALLQGADGDHSESPKKLLFGEKTQITLEKLTGRSHANLTSSNNVYKLYLLMNQMNPQLFYATFMEQYIYPKLNGTISTGCYNWSENTGEVSDEQTNWNSATFLLCLLLNEADGNIRTEGGDIVIAEGVNPWEKWGVTLDLYTLSDEEKEKGMVKGNCFTYESDRENITDCFATNASIPYQQHVAEVFEYYGNKEESITVSEIVHYLVQMTAGGAGEQPGHGYDKEIRILELQPSESFLEPITWEWNINTYIDGFRGTHTVTQQSSAEFIGKIEDLNSSYDLLYIGSDISEYAANRTVLAQELLDKYADAEPQWYDAGSTVILAEKTKLMHKKQVYQSYAAGTQINVQIPQKLKTAGQIWGQSGAEIEVTVTQGLYIKGLEAKDSSKYSADILAALARGEARDVTVLAGDRVMLATDRWVKTIEEQYFAAGAVISADKNPVAQDVLVYTDVTEWMPAGSKVVLSEGMNLRTLNDIPEWTNLQPYSYFHTGAIVDMDENNNIELTGILGGNADRVNQYYYSGNDITKVKMQEILEFAEAGYPVVVASRLMNRDGEGKLQVDTTAVDRASNMYLLLSTLAKAESDPDSPYYGNLFYEGTAMADENYLRYKRQLLEALTETKCELKINRMPVLYANDKSTAESYLNGAPGKENDKTVEISFLISDAEYANYHLQFYIDQNADGRYDESERLTGKMKIYEVVLGRTQEVTQLKPDRNYTMEANLEDYVGVIPWKLEIVRSDNPVIRDSVIECCAILPAEQEKPTLQVLQVIPDYVKDANGNVTQCSSIYLPSKEEAAAMEWWMARWEDVGNDRQAGWDAATKNKWESFWNEKGLMEDLGNGQYRRWTLDEIAAHLKAHYLTWQSRGFSPDYVIDQMYVSQELSHMFMGELEDSIPYDGGSGGRRRSSVGFWLYIRAVQDFRIEVTRQTVSEFIAETAKCKAEDGGDVSAWALELFDMMILGFNDCYQDIRDDDALKVIEDFCAAGKQILFTHDTTSFRNYSQSSEQFKTGIYWGYNINREFRDILGMDRFGATLMYPLDINGNLMSDGLSISQAIEKKNDAPYKNGMTQDISSQEKILQNVLNTNVNGTVKYYVHGYSDSLLYRFSNERYTTPLNTKCASKVNIGQLTEYPYRIGDEITIAETHETYYQLDMEAEDIVVWYALEATPGDVTAGTDYAGTHHDVRNNYYLYSRGNIIYTGLGHNSYLTKDELKLFVNTFVASYRIEADPPAIEVQNSNATTAGAEYFYIDFDSWDEMRAVGTEVVVDGDGTQFQRVRFVIKETTALRNLKMTMEYYLTASSDEGVELTELTGTSGVVKQSGYYVTKDAGDNPVEIMVSGAKLDTFRSSDDVPVTELETDEEYYVDIPISLLNGRDGAELLFRAKLNYGRQNDQYVYSYQKVRFLRRGLYDLD